MTARATAIARWSRERRPEGASEYQFFEVHEATVGEALAKAERVISRFGNGVGVIVWPDNAADDPVVQLTEGGELTYADFLQKYGVTVGLTGPVV